MTRLRARLARLNDERGVAVVTAIMVSAVATMLMLVAVRLSLHASSESARDRRRVQAIAAAEAGINHYLSHLQAVPLTQAQCSVTLTLDGRPPTSFTVTPTFYDAADTAIPCPLAAGVRPAGVHLRSVGTSSAATPARTMEAYARLNVLGSDTFGTAALFSDQSPKLSSNVQIYGNASSDGDIYTNGDLEIPANVVVYGSGFAQGKLTVNSNSEVKKDAWANGSVFLKNSTVLGNAVSSTSSVTVSGAQVYGNATAATTVTISGGKSKVHGTVSPNTPSPAPPAQQLPQFTFDAAAWQAAGYTVSNQTNCSSAASYIKTITGGSHAVRVSSTCHLVLSSLITVRGDLAIIADGPVTFDQATVVSDGSAHAVHVIAGLSGTSPCDLNVRLSTFTADLSTFLYSPCTVKFSSNGSVFNGQVFAGKLDVSANVTFNYRQTPIPGSSGGGLTEDLLYLREIVTQ